MRWFFNQIFLRMFKEALKASNSIARFNSMISKYFETKVSQKIGKLLTAANFYREPHEKKIQNIFMHV